MGFHTIFSASLISDYKGDEYQRIEYTPYGETWVEKTSNTGLEWLPYKFTAKEIDKETGLYYYGARYLDPKYSKWISTDPALGEYIPKAPIDDDAKKYNQNLPGMGGVFNHINGNLYAYAANNPVRYIDPDGNFYANYWANYRFNKNWKNYRNQYQQKLELLFKQAKATGNFDYKVPANKSFDKAVLDDFHNSEKEISNTSREFAIKSLNYEENSKDYNEYIKSELAQYSKLQKLRIDKEIDGSNKSGKVDQILNNAWKIYDNELNESKKKGLDSYDSYRNAEKKANDYINQQLTKEGL